MYRCCNSEENNMLEETTLFFPTDQQAELSVWSSSTNYFVVDIHIITLRKNRLNLNKIWLKQKGALTVTKSPLSVLQIPAFAISSFGLYLDTLCTLDELKDAIHDEIADHYFRKGHVIRVHSVWENLKICLTRCW